METPHEKLESELDSTLDALVSPTSRLSCAEAAQRMSTICADYFKAKHSAQLVRGADEDEGDSDHGFDFFFALWCSIVRRVHDAPVEEQQAHEYITRLLDLVDQCKRNPPPEGIELSFRSEKYEWRDLPALGAAIREYYDIERIEGKGFESSIILSSEGQAALAGAIKLEPRHLSGDSQPDPIRIAKSRHQWLSLESFISRLWRDYDRDEYALYAIWALRPGLEDWPESPPSWDAKSKTLEESPAYLAFQVEAAAIWICNTAPLMYQCTGIWGPKGDPDWPKNAGTPGRGGRRWEGVDGYDREHKRWQLWKDVLGEVVEWCDREDPGQNKGWKVRDAAVRALEAMKAAEQQAPAA